MDAALAIRAKVAGLVLRFQGGRARRAALASASDRE
jgi:hypothetical protein